MAISNEDDPGTFSQPIILIRINNNENSSRTYHNQWALHLPGGHEQVFPLKLSTQKNFGGKFPSKFSNRKILGKITFEGSHISLPFSPCGFVGFVGFAAQRTDLSDRAEF